MSNTDMEKTNNTQAAEQPAEVKPQFKVEELVESGKNKGTLTLKEVADQLEGVELEPDQLDKILDMLDTLGVDVVSEIELPEPEALPEETGNIDDLDLSVPEGISTDDPVRMYLKEIGKVPLLTADVFSTKLQLYASNVPFVT